MNPPTDTRKRRSCFTSGGSTKRCTKKYLIQIIHYTNQSFNKNLNLSFIKYVILIVHNKKKIDEKKMQHHYLNGFGENEKSDEKQKKTIDKTSQDFSPHIPVLD